MGDGFFRALAAIARLVGGAPSLRRSPARVTPAVSGRPAGLDVVGPWLRPGDWELILTRSGLPVAAVRVGAAIPEHIDGPAFARSGTAGQVTRQRRRFVLERDDSGEAFQADVWLMRHSGKWLLFDLERSEVLRWVDEPMTEEYEALRRAFARHVPSVGFAVSRSRRSLTEPVIEGEMLQDVSEESREHACRVLLRDLAPLVRVEGTSDMGGVGTRVMARTSPLTEVQGQEHELVTLVGERPITVPVHADLGAHNVLVTDESGPVVIDFGSLHRGPFYADALQVANQLPEVWGSGGLDEELGEVWEAAGAQPVRWDAGKVRLAMLARAAAGAERRMRQTRPPLKALKRRVKAAEIRAAWERQVAQLP